MSCPHGASGCQHLPLLRAGPGGRRPWRSSTDGGSEDAGAVRVDGVRDGPPQTEETRTCVDGDVLSSTRVR